MKKCYQCGTPWRSYGPQPRTREVCEGCGAHLRCCANCHHYGHRISSCKLKESFFVGPRTALNYCEHFRMADTVAKEAEARIVRARDRWEALFGG